MLDEDLRGTKTIVVETFDSNCHLFNLVEEDNKYYLKYEKDSLLITKLIIKPDLWIFYKDGGYEQGINLLLPVIKSEKKVLAMNFYIDPSIFDILISNDLISYSKGMADLYNLPTIYSRDIKYHRHDYKWAKTKKLTLNKMRQGIFN